MTDSMIPYSFIPGTKAKASEVNANFSALAQVISQNAAFTTNKITETVEQINGLLDNKADKTELITEHTITEEQTNLNDYKTKGTYIFSSSYIPLNVPKNSAGILIVVGEETSEIKQIWICNGSNPMIYTREYINSSWNDWNSVYGIYHLASNGSTGYIKLPTGVILQWGLIAPASVTFPIAFQGASSIVFSKAGYGSSYERSDTGIIEHTLTGFKVGTAGVFNCMNWFAIGV